jgi:hypothetical protein
VLQDAEELAAQPVHLHRVGAKPAPAAPLAAPLTAKTPAPVVEHAALGRLAPKAASPATAQTPASACQLAQEPSAAPVRAEALPAAKKPLGRPRKAAALAPADVADILQADLPDTRPAAPPVPAQQAIEEAHAAQAQRQPATAAPSQRAEPLRVPSVVNVGGNATEANRQWGGPGAALMPKEHAALCAYSAQVKMLRTDDEIGAAVRALGAEDASILRQVDRLRRLGGHSRTLCASDDAAVDRLTKAGLVVVLPWNGPKPPSPACYAELTPAGSAVLALLPQPSRTDDAETTRTLQRYVEPRKTGRPPGKD